MHLVVRHAPSSSVHEAGATRESLLAIVVVFPEGRIFGICSLVEQT